MVYAFVAISSHYLTLCLCLTVESLVKNYITHDAIQKILPIRVAVSRAPPTPTPMKLPILSKHFIYTVYIVCIFCNKVKIYSIQSTTLNRQFCIS